MICKECSLEFSKSHKDKVFCSKACADYHRMKERHFEYKNIGRVYDGHVERWVKYYGYEISDMGRIRRNDKVLRPSKINGYLAFQFYIDGIMKRHLIHRLVATFFIRPPKNGEVVNHKNGERDYNHYTNLEWCTPKQNSEHASKMGFYKNNHLKKRVRSYHNGSFYKDFDSLAEASKDTNVNQCLISRVLKIGKKKKKVGFDFYFI